MMKIKNFMSRPITWGDYAKMCAVSIPLGIVAVIIELISWGYFDDWIEGLKKKFNKEVSE